MKQHSDASFQPKMCMSGTRQIFRQSFVTAEGSCECQVEFKVRRDLSTLYFLFFCKSRFVLRTKFIRVREREYFYDTYNVANIQKGSIFQYFSKILFRNGKFYESPVTKVCRGLFLPTRV